MGRFVGWDGVRCGDYEVASMLLENLKIRRRKSCYELGA